MKLLKSSTFHWSVLGIVSLLCIIVLTWSPSPYKENTSYHTVSRQLLEDLSVLNTEEYLTIGHGRFTQSTLESMDEKIRNATLSANVIEENSDRIQIKISTVKLSQDNELFAIEKTPNLFFRRQYVLQEGAVLNYQFLPSDNKNTLCFYIHEVSRLRCMNH
jgi:hypothetical protein